jgi:hypothetical protein
MRYLPLLANGGSDFAACGYTIAAVYPGEIEELGNFCMNTPSERKFSSFCHFFKKSLAKQRKRD